MKQIILSILNLAMYAVMFLSIMSIVITWVPQLRWSPLGRLVYNITEPVYMRVRRIFPPIVIKQGVGLDFTPWIAFFATMIIYTVLTMLVKKIIP